MTTLNLTAHVLAFEDALANNNPQLRPVDWRRALTGVQVDAAWPEVVHLAPFEEAAVFSGARALTADGTTQYALTLSPLASDRYRLAWTGTGAAPGFRTARALALATGNVTLTLNANLTVTVTSSLGSVFGAVQVGDTLHIPGVTTGDSALFDPMNEGDWTVLAASAASLTVARAPDAVFSGATETKAVAANTQVQAYSAAGVQVGDTLDVTAGFAPSARRSYVVAAVTARHVEFTSGAPLAAETVVPGAAAVALYGAAKTFVYVETNQEVAVKLNGATDESCRVEPIIAGDPNRPGLFWKTGTTYSLSVRNRSAAPARVFVIVAE